MYAAAGGASLASRQARRNIRKQHLQAGAHGPDVHQQFKRRLDLLQAHHGPAHFLREPSFSDLHSRAPSASDITEGKAATAWADHRRVSVAESGFAHRAAAHHRQQETHRKWRSRNRIHDSSYGGSSSEEDEGGGGLYGQQSAAANALLYVGLGTVAIGLVIAFVGTGEKGFKTVELRLIGPSLIASGLLCCLLRVFLCIIPSCCRRAPKDKKPDPTREYYRHLPFSSRAQQQPGAGALMGVPPNKKKKRVSILAGVPRIVVPEATDAGRGSWSEELPSPGSEEAPTDAAAAARLARLRSTLTFGDSLDAPDFARRLADDDSDAPASSPLLPAPPAALLPPEPPASLLAMDERPIELVLTPAQLRRD